MDFKCYQDEISNSKNTNQLCYKKQTNIKNDVRFTKYASALFATYILKCNNLEHIDIDDLLKSDKTKIMHIDTIHQYIVDEDIPNLMLILPTISIHRLTIYIFFALFFCKPKSLKLFMKFIYRKTLIPADITISELDFNSQSYMVYKMKKDFIRIMDIACREFIQFKNPNAAKCIILIMSIYDGVFLDKILCDPNIEDEEFLVSLNKEIMSNEEVAKRFGHYLTKTLIPLYKKDTLIYFFEIIDLKTFLFIKEKFPGLLELFIATIIRMVPGDRLICIKNYLAIRQEPITINYIYSEIDSLLNHLKLEDLRSSYKIIDLCLQNKYGDVRELNYMIRKLFQHLCTVSVYTLDQWEVLNDIVALLCSYANMKQKIYGEDEELIPNHYRNGAVYMDNLSWEGLDELSAGIICLTCHHIQGYMALDLSPSFDAMARAGCSFQEEYIFKTMEDDILNQYTCLSTYFFIIFNKMGGNISYCRWFEFKCYSRLIECFKNKMESSFFIRSCEEICVLAKEHLCNELDHFGVDLIRYLNKQIEMSKVQCRSLYGLCQEVVLLKVANCDLNECKEYNLPKSIVFDMEMYYKQKPIT